MHSAARTSISSTFAGGPANGGVLMLRPDTFALTALLALLSALGPVSTDMYLSSLPDIGRKLGATPAEVQLTLSVFLVGFAVGQIVYGPLSDRYGRKPVVMAALSIYVVGCLACSFATSIETLLAARVAQALGGSGAVVLARAIVRDLYSGARAGRELSLMGAIMALAPVGRAAGRRRAANRVRLAREFSGRARDRACGADAGLAPAARDDAHARAGADLACRHAADLSQHGEEPRVPRASRHRRAELCRRCSPGFRARRSSCRTFTGSPRSPSGSRSRRRASASCSGRRLRRGSSRASASIARSGSARLRWRPAGWR